MSTTAEFYAALDRCLAAGETTAVATIVRRKGSSPREVGAKMLVRPNGDTDGSVGGGCGEAEVWRTALDVMADREARMVVVDLTEEIAMDTDGVCGGVMEIFVEPWTARAGDGREHARPADHVRFAGTTDDRELTRGLLDAVAAKQPALTATVVGRSGGAPCALGAKLLVVAGTPRVGGLGWHRLEERVLADVPAVIADGRSQVRVYAFEADGDNGRRASGRASVFFEPALPKPVLLVVGAGHVAVPIAQVGKLLDFEVVVVDDRPSFANAERFPTADRIVVDDFEAALDALPITPSTYVVLVTRGHVHDVRSLRRILDKPAAYIGMIGSRRRVFAVFKLMHEEGVPVETLLRVHAPIGLDIETETPGEIALSVGAEILKARRGGRAASLSDRVREQYRASLTKDVGRRTRDDGSVPTAYRPSFGVPRPSSA
jgi:xanthine dehydrogenase accessory factor